MLDSTGSVYFLGIRSSNALSDQANLYKLDSLGNHAWSKILRLEKPGFDSFDLQVHQLGYLPGEGLYLSGEFNNYNGTSQDEHFVMKLHPDGTPAIMKTTGSHALTQLYTGNDGVYLLGKSVPGTFPFTGNAADAVLAILDRNLEFQWAKVFHAQAFDYANATLNLAADGTLVLGYSTFGAYPVVLARLDADGNILWQKGYPLYEPQIDALGDGGLLLTTQRHFDATGALFPKMIIARTDPQGDIQGCPTFPACLESSPLSLNLGTFQAQDFPGDPPATPEHRHRFGAVYLLRLLRHPGAALATLLPARLAVPGRQRLHHRHVQPFGTQNPMEALRQRHRPHLGGLACLPPPLPRPRHLHPRTKRVVPGLPLRRLPANYRARQSERLHRAIRQSVPAASVNLAGKRRAPPGNFSMEHRRKHPSSESFSKRHLRRHSQRRVLRSSR